MKKLLLLAIISLCICSGLMSQEVKSKSLVVQKLDSVNYREIFNTQNRLTYYYSENRTSQFFIIAGSVIAIAGSFLYKPKENGVNYFTIGGGAIGFLGGCIYLDSFKFLNFNKKYPKNQMVDEIY